MKAAVQAAKLVEEASLRAKEMERTKQMFSNRVTTVEDVKTIVMAELEKFLQNELTPITVQEIEAVVERVLRDNMVISVAPKVKATHNNKGEVVIDVVFIPMVKQELRVELSQFDEKQQELLRYIDERLDKIKLEE